MYIPPATAAAIINGATAAANIATTLPAAAADAPAPAMAPPTLATAPVPLTIFFTVLPYFKKFSAFLAYLPAEPDFSTIKFLTVK